MAFFLFLNFRFIFLIPAVTTQIFNPIAELAIPTGLPIKEAKASSNCRN